VCEDEPFDPWASAAADGTSAAVMKSGKKKLLSYKRRGSQLHPAMCASCFATLFVGFNVQLHFNLEDI